MADFIPANHRAAGSESALATVDVDPLAVKSFLVVPVRPFGHSGEALSFTVTALDAARQPVTDYTGTVLVTSPTDSNTVFPARTYVALGIKPPPPVTMGLATFQNQVYTFTPADHGTHTFINGVTFNKGVRRDGEGPAEEQLADSRHRDFRDIMISVRKRRGLRSRRARQPFTPLRAAGAYRRWGVALTCGVRRGFSK